MDLSKLPITNRKTIPEKYLDFIGHMNVMYYAHLFDQATFNFYKEIGFGKDYHTQSGKGSMALEQHTCYLAEVRAGESVTVRSRFLGYSEKTFHFMHFMIKDEGEELAATTEIIGIHVDMNTRRSSPIPEEIAAEFNVLYEQHSNLDWDPPGCGSMGLVNKP